MWMDMAYMNYCHLSHIMISNIFLFKFIGFAMVCYFVAVRFLDLNIIFLIEILLYLKRVHNIDDVIKYTASTIKAFRDFFRSLLFLRVFFYISGYGSQFEVDFQTTFHMMLLELQLT